MNKDEALAYLNCKEEEWEDVIISKVFEHKQFLLKSITTPQVFIKRSEKLFQLQLASDVLFNKSFTPKIDELPTLELVNLSSDTILEFYRTYEKSMSQYKLGLMRTLIPGEASFYARKLAELEATKLLSLSNYKELTLLSLEEVKISDFVNSGEIMQELKSRPVHSIDSKNIASYPNFQKDIIRSIKYANFMASKKNK